MKLIEIKLMHINNYLILKKNYYLDLNFNSKFVTDMSSMIVKFFFEKINDSKIDFIFSLK